MAMVDWLRAGMEVVDGMNARQNQGGCSHVGDAGAFPECEVIH